MSKQTAAVVGWSAAFMVSIILWAVIVGAGSLVLRWMGF